jgi:hypothetical protein
MWRQRLNNTTADKIFREDENNLIGPHDVHYLNEFVCENHCYGNASSPWAIVTGEMVSYGEHKGDWHNNPAWVWAHHYTPLSWAGSLYDYQCLEESCRRTYYYAYNPYWADSYWTIGGSGGGGTPPCQTPPCPLTAPTAAVAEAVSPEQRWDFEDLSGLTVVGAGVKTIETDRITDPDWGYKRGASVLRIVGAGKTQVVLRRSIDTDENDFLIVRFRQDNSTGSGPRVGWGEMTQGVVRDDREVDSQFLRESGGWQIRQVPLASFDSWRSMRSANAISLIFDLGPNLTTLEVDFVIVSR